VSAVLTKQSKVECIHQGTVSQGPGAIKLTVKGQAVLRAADVGPGISGCTYVPPVPPGGSTCVTVAALTPGNATKLRVAGVPVLLDTTAGTTSSTPVVGTLKVTAQQTKLTAK
jgi:hypothetical protein